MLNGCGFRAYFIWKEEDVRRANASTTKIMTLIVTLEHADLNNVVTFSDYAASQPDVQLNGASGEQFLLKDLCFSLMLESHNDSAVQLRNMWQEVWRHLLA